MKQRKPSEYNSDRVRHTSECAFQRAIIQGDYSIVNGEKIKWIDIELPVDDSPSSRGKCIDLIGKDSRGVYVLCELKFRKKSDNGGPEEAANQIKGYYEEIKKNADELNKIELGHTHATAKIDWEKVASNETRLMVVANKFYWETWCERKKTVLSDRSIEYYSVNIERYTFERQKGAKVYYKPQMESQGFKWKKI